MKKKRIERFEFFGSKLQKVRKPLLLNWQEGVQNKVSTADNIFIDRRHFRRTWKQLLWNRSTRKWRSPHEATRHNSPSTKETCHSTDLRFRQQLRYESYPQRKAQESHPQQMILLRFIRLVRLVTSTVIRFMNLV